MKKFIVRPSAILLSLAFTTSVFASDMQPDYQKLVNQAYQLYKNDKSGTVASYIPELATYSPNLYAITLVTVDGKVYSAGDTKAKFPLESLAKVFTLALALQQSGNDTVLNKIGASATGLPFNSVLGVELQANHTGNGLVNAGAISAVSLIKAKNSAEKWQLIANNLDAYAGGDKLEFNNAVYKSEMATNQHNQGIARLLQSYGRLYDNVEDSIDVYTRECSVDVSTEQLAQMAAVLANYGKSPLTQQQLLSHELLKPLLAEMTTAGMYDASGNWLYKVGLPAKSGVAGGVIAIAPGKFAIAAYSPPLDNNGNSVRGQEAIRYIANQAKASLFEKY
ncbi:MAG: hypothetical protein RLZZ293_528 [Pseudomonadota bacterium]|jgi:glutaminase